MVACGRASSSGARYYVGALRPGVRNQTAGNAMRLCWAQILFIVVIAVLGLGSMLSACGQKGPLYLPDHASQSAQQNGR